MFSPLFVALLLGALGALTSSTFPAEAMAHTLGSKSLSRAMPITRNVLAQTRPSLAQIAKPPQRQPPMPNLIGAELTTARQRLAELKLDLQVTTQPVPDSQGRRDIVVRQTPIAGSALQPGQLITLYITQPAATFPRPFPGRPTVPVLPLDVLVPYLITLPQARAEAQLRNAGLQRGQIVEQSSNAPAGTVIAQSLKPFSRAPRGAKLNLTIAVRQAFTIVPSVIGRTQEEAKQILAKAKLTVGQVNTAPSNAPPGQVIAQTPAAGTRLAERSSVDLTVAARAEAATVPNVVGQQLAQALIMLRRARLDGGEIERRPSDDSPDKVIAQAIQPGVRVQPGTKINLTVTTQRQFVIVPNVIGQPSAQAEAILQGAGLRSTTARQKTSGFRADTVFAQDPPANTRVALNSVVRLVVAVPETVPVPDVRQKELSEAERLVRLARLNPVVVDRRAGNVGVPTVVAQSPPTGIEVPLNSNVNLSVIQPAPTPVITTPTATRTATPTPSLTVTPTPTESASVSPTPSSSLTPTPAVIQPPTPVSSPTNNRPRTPTPTPSLPSEGKTSFQGWLITAAIAALLLAAVPLFRWLKPVAASTPAQPAAEKQPPPPGTPFTVRPKHDLGQQRLRLEGKLRADYDLGLRLLQGLEQLQTQIRGQLLETERKKDE